jgi:hypothetical protein
MEVVSREFLRSRENGALFSETHSLRAERVRGNVSGVLFTRRASLSESGCSSDGRLMLSRLAKKFSTSGLMIFIPGPG